MYCPNCGHQPDSFKDNFCSDCGFAFDKIKPLLNRICEASTSIGDQILFKVGTPLAEIERRTILLTLEKVGGNKTHAAEILGISLKTLHNKLNSYRQEDKK